MSDQIISAGSAVVMVKTNDGAVEIVDDRERDLPPGSSSTATASAKSVITNNTSSKTPPTSPMSISSSPSPSKGSSKSSSSSSTKNSGSKSLSPWRTLQRLRKRKTNSNNDNENHHQRQQNQLSLPSPSSTSTVSSTQSVSVIRVPIKSSSQVANSRQKQKSPQTAGGGGTKSSNKDDTSGETVAETEELTMEIPEPPKIQNVSTPKSLDPAVSTTGIATSQTKTRTSNNSSSSSSESAPAVSPATTTTSSTANNRTIESARDSIAVLRGNGMAIPMVRTKSIIKRPSNVTNSDDDDEEEDPFESKDDKNSSQRKSVSFCEKSLAEAERDSPSSRNRKRKLWDNIMLAMPVILPYLIAIIILIFACLVQPADQQHQQVHGRSDHASSPSSTPVHGEQTEQQPPSSLSFILTRKQSQRKSTNNISALSQVPDDDEDHQNDDDNITSMSGIWSEMFQNIFSGVVSSKLVEIENANESTIETTTRACETQDTSGGRWYYSVFSSFSTKEGHDDSVRSLHKQQTKDTLSDHHDGKIVGVKQRRNLLSRLWKKIRRVERS